MRVLIADILKFEGFLAEEVEWKRKRKFQKVMT